MYGFLCSLPALNTTLLPCMLFIDILIGLSRIPPDTQATHSLSSSPAAVTPSTLSACKESKTTSLVQSKLWFGPCQKAGNNVSKESYSMFVKLDCVILCAIEAFLDPYFLPYDCYVLNITSV